MKQPAIQFYVGDWRKDPSVTCLSYAAKGLWWEMLLLMFESQVRGYLLLESGNSMTVQQIARATGGSAIEVEELLREMEAAGTFSYNTPGEDWYREELPEETIVNRRMARKARIGTARSKAGSAGGRATSKRYFAAAKDTAKPPASSSSSSSSVSSSETSSSSLTAVEPETEQNHDDESVSHEAQMGGYFSDFAKFFGRTYAPDQKLRQRAAQITAGQSYERIEEFMLELRDRCRGQPPRGSIGAWLVACLEAEFDDGTQKTAGNTIAFRPRKTA